MASAIPKEVPRGFGAAPALFKVRCFSSLHAQKISTPWLPWEKVVIRRIFHFIILLRCRPKWEMRDISLSIVSGSLKRREKSARVNRTTPEMQEASGHFRDPCGDHFSLDMIHSFAYLDWFWRQLLVILDLLLTRWWLCPP